MTRQRLALVLIAVGMSLHALVRERFLESFFGIAAFASGFIGWATFRNRLADAEAMAISMAAILLAAALAFGALSSDMSSVSAHLSLALAPAAMAFACVTFYIAHIQSPRIDEPLVDWTSAVAMAAAEKMRKAAAVMLPIVVGEGGPQLLNESIDAGPAITSGPGGNPVAGDRAA